MPPVCHRLPDHVALAGRRGGIVAGGAVAGSARSASTSKSPSPFVAVLLVAATAWLPARARTRPSASGPRTLRSTPWPVARTVGALGVRVAPSAATIRRGIALVCLGGLAVLTGADPAGSDRWTWMARPARGPRHGTSPAALLLAAMIGDGRTITQLRVPNKTNEITCFAALLEPFDLARVTVTADALHTQRTHSRFLVEEKKAPYLLVGKANQPELHRRLRTLPWKNVTARRYDREIGQVTGKPRDKGPHRHRSRPGLPPRRPGRPRPAPPHRPQDRAVSRQSVYAIIGVTSQEASPQRLGHIARPHWTIENWLRSARDTTFAEDTSKIRTGHGPENMATRGRGAERARIILACADGKPNV